MKKYIFLLALVSLNIYLQAAEAGVEAKEESAEVVYRSKNWRDELKKALQKRPELESYMWLTTHPFLLWHVQSIDTQKEDSNCISAVVDLIDNENIRTQRVAMKFELPQLVCKPISPIDLSERARIRSTPKFAQILNNGGTIQTTGIGVSPLEFYPAKSVTMLRKASREKIAEPRKLLDDGKSGVANGAGA